MTLVFLSGPQGSGKTTFSRLLAERDERVLIPDLETTTIPLDTEPLLRAALKICQRSLENFEYSHIAQEKPDKIVIGNRCIYDQFAFNRVYAARGWMRNGDIARYDEASHLFYAPELHRPLALMLNPGFDVVKKHLEKRWKEDGKKWREDDMQYIRAACDSYEQFRGRKEIFYIDHEIDLTSNTDFDAVRGWFDSIHKNASEPALAQALCK